MSSQDPNSNETSRGLVDFHCHLDLYPDLGEAIADCEQAGVYTLAVTTTPKAWPRNQELASRTRHVRAALGLHPQLVAERADEIGLWESYLPETSYIGEVGLDAGPRFYRSLDLQVEMFRRILASAADAGGKILSVHSVRASTRVLTLIEEHLPADRGRVVLHWFTGSAAEARRAVSLGCYFSVNRTMLEKPAAQKLIAGLPLNRLLTETDGPFTRCGERPAKPSDVRSTIQALAESLAKPPEELRSLVAANLKRLLVEAQDARDLKSRS